MCEAWCEQMRRASGTSHVSEDRERKVLLPLNSRYSSVSYLFAFRFVTELKVVWLVFYRGQGEPIRKFKCGLE